jgi:membrane protein implicated in regulation of membrane protease activity
VNEQEHRDRQRRAALEELGGHFGWAYFIWIPLAAAAVCLVVGIFTFDATFIVIAAVAGLSAGLMWLAIREC